MIQAYIGDLAAYNSGHLDGFFLDLSEDEDEMAEKIEKFLAVQSSKYGENHEEVEVFDWEVNFNDHGEISRKFGQYVNLPAWAELMIAIKEYDAEVVCAALMADIPLDDLDRYNGSAKNPAEFAQDYYEEMLMVPEHIKNSAPWYHVSWRDVADEMDDFHFVVYHYEKTYVFNTV